MGLHSELTTLVGAGDATEDQGGEQGGAGQPAGQWGVGSPGSLDHGSVPPAPPPAGGRPLAFCQKMKTALLQFLGSEFLRSPMLRFLTTTLLGMIGFCVGLVSYWKSLGILLIMIAPLPLGFSATIAVIGGAVVAVVPFEKLSASGRKTILPAALIVALMLSGVAGYVFGEALTGI